MTAYYNEIDPQAAQWLRNLIAAGEIAPGDVDERSVWDVHPDDLKPYVQCHFFAGIGIWSDALRRAGWADDRPVWTGSCPCQPFSAAGKGRGFADDRHLWPAWAHLIRERAPRVVFGEQVEGHDGKAWLDVVQADLERGDYAVGPVVLPAAGFGAPHGRHRFFFVADAKKERYQRGGAAWRRRDGSADGGDARPVADANGREPGNGELQPRGEHGQLAQNGPIGGWWADAEWIACTDGRSRPIEPGTFPLVDGAPSRLVRIRAYGNAIAAPVAAGFIAAYMSI